jgi:hypothetical protein
MSLVVCRSKSTLTDLRTSFLAFAAAQWRARSPVQSFNPMPPSIGEKMASVIPSVQAQPSSIARRSRPARCGVLTRDDARRIAANWHHAVADWPDVMPRGD